MTLTIRQADKATDKPAIWRILEPIIRAGETYPLPRDMKEKAALAYWLSSLHTTFVAVENETIIGTYYIRPNNSGGGAHIANCGFMVAQDAQGKGVARAMCTHALAEATAQGYKGMQFNFVIASNVGAIGLWTSFGFETLCRLPEVFDHPKEGLVDALIMFKKLEPNKR